MNVDPKWLARRVRQGPGSSDLFDVIDDDTPCRKCGYNLRGLRIPGVCPECGEPTGERAREHAPGAERHGPASYHDLPIGELRRLSVIGRSIGWGMSVMAAGWLANWGFIIVRVGANVDAPPQVSAWLLGLIALPGALAWCLGISALFLGWGVRDGDVARSAYMPAGWRAWTTVLGQWLWIFAIAAAAISAAVGGPNSANAWGGRAQWTAVFFALGGSIALGAASRWLFEIASAADDDFAANRMRGGLFSMPFVAGFLSLGPVLAFFLGVYGLGTMMMIGLTGIVAIPISMFVAGVAALGATMRWGAVNAGQTGDRNRRFRERSIAQARHEGSRLVRD